MIFTLTAPGIWAFFLGAFTILATYLFTKLWHWCLDQADYSVIVFAVFLSLGGAAAWAGMFVGAFH